MSLVSKRTLKGVLGELPLTAEVYWRLLQQGQPLSKSFSLNRVEEKLPAWRAQAQKSRQQAAGREKAVGRGKAAGGKRIFIFSTLLYWIEHTTLLGLSMSGLGHEVTLAYLPYANWRTPFNRFDLRRQNAYAKGILSQTAPLVNSLSLLDVKTGADGLPAPLAERIREVSLRDAQYTLQVEDIDQSHTSNNESARLYRLRVARNTQAASAALTWMQANHPEVVIVPNGSILEMGAVYQAARYLEIPVVTYEFGEQRQRIWLAQNAEVMRQDTQALWQARQDLPLQEAQWDQIRTLFASRQRASLWENFSRRWQGLPSQGGDKVRAELGLDGRPLVLLAANVIGDSLTLGRQVFSDSMTEWLTRTVQYFAGQPQVQLVIRIHPGERYTQGPSVADVVRQALPDVDSLSHIHLVEAQAPVNTYDLVEIADLGLVYTTTVGMEMAMSAVPVIVVGQTHYRSKGFTLDPQSWQAYFDMLQKALAEPARLRPSREQVERAWNYAYRFFFEYPNPFPWHLLHFWNELERWPLERVLSREGQQEFGQAFRYLAGETRQWTNIA